MGEVMEIKAEHIRAALNHTVSQYWNLVRDLICAELREEYLPLETLLDEEISEKTALLAEARESVDVLQRQIDELTVKIGRIEGRCLEFQAATTDTDDELRIESGLLWRAWDQDLRIQEQKRNQLEQELEPLIRHRDDCQQERDSAVLGKAD